MRLALERENPALDEGDQQAFFIDGRRTATKAPHWAAFSLAEVPSLV